MNYVRTVTCSEDYQDTNLVLGIEQREGDILWPRPVPVCHLASGTQSEYISQRHRPVLQSDKLKHIY